MQSFRCEPVSIIITTHKGSNTIVRAVNSVMEQDYPNIEIIVIDDNGKGSIEQIETEKALHKYIVEGSILYHPHEINRNGSAARNTGIAISTGEYIGLLDDDDIYLPGKITKSIEALSKLSDEWGAVYTDVIIDYGDRGRYLNRYHREGKIVFDMLAHTIFMNPSVIIMRKKAISQIGGFDETFLRHQDWEFNARFADEFKIAHVGIVGSVYNCQVKRNFNPSATKAYRDYYIKKMKPIIQKLTILQQRVIYSRNAIDIVGFHFNSYKECRNISLSWGEKIDYIAYCSAVVLTVLERVRTKMSKQD